MNFLFSFLLEINEQAKGITRSEPRIRTVCTLGMLQTHQEAPLYGRSSRMNKIQSAYHCDQNE